MSDRLPKEVEEAIAAIPEHYRDAVRHAYLNQDMRDVDAWIIPNTSEEFAPSDFLNEAKKTETAFYEALTSAVESISSKRA